MALGSLKQHLQAYRRLVCAVMHSRAREKEKMQGLNYTHSTRAFLHSKPLTMAERDTWARHIAWGSRAASQMEDTKRAIGICSAIDNRHLVPDSDITLMVICMA